MTLSTILFTSYLLGAVGAAVYGYHVLDSHAQAKYATGISRHVGIVVLSIFWLVLLFGVLVVAIIETVKSGEWDNEDDQDNS